MTFLALNGTTIPCASDQTKQEDEEHRIDRERMFDGSVRMSRQGVYRMWTVTTSLLTETDANTILALIRTDNPPLTATGDLMGGVSVGVAPIPGSADPIHTASGFRRRLTFQLKETIIPAAVDTSAVVWGFWRAGYGMYTDFAKTTSASDGDLIRMWAEQSGTGWDWRCGDDDLGHTEDNYRPTRDGDVIRFGLGGVKTAFHTSSTAMTNSWLALGTEREIMVAIKTVDDPPATDATGGLWAFMGSGGGNSYYPAADGHIKEGFNIEATVSFQTVPVDCGDPATSLNNTYNVYNVSAGNSAWTARLNNAELHSSSYPNPPSDGCAGGLNLGVTQVVAQDHLNGWIKHLAIFQGILTTSQRLAWYNFMRGATSSPPLP